MKKLQTLIAAIDAHPDSFQAHEALRKFEMDQRMLSNGQSKKIASIIDKQYAEWERRYPDSPEMQLAIGMHLNEQEDPRAVQHILKYLELDSDSAKPHARAHAKAYAMLAGLATFREDAKAEREYLHKATMLEPKNADYAIRYARSMGSDAAFRDVIRQFPGTQTAAWAFAGMCDNAPNDTKRREMFERLLAQFPPAKYDASIYGAFHLYDIYLRVDPAEALKLAQQIQQVEKAGHQFGSWDWPKLENLAQTFVEARHLMDAGDASKAVGLLGALTSRRFPPISPTGAMLARFKAQVFAVAGKPNDAYKELLQQQATAPDDQARAALQYAGALLHKTKKQVEAAVKATRYANAKMAPSFDLEAYGSDQSISLAKLRGKVVFLTFFYPGCGPCRAELPHLEAEVKQFPKTDLAFLGINSNRSQDVDVLPFVKNGKHIFTPLKGTDAVLGPAGYDVKVNPYNVLIDREGRIVYSGFMIDAQKKQMLRNMIKSLL